MQNDSNQNTRRHIAPTQRNTIKEDNTKIKNSGGIVNFQEQSGQNDENRPNDDRIHNDSKNNQKCEAETQNGQTDNGQNDELDKLGNGHNHKYTRDWLLAARNNNQSADENESILPIATIARRAARALLINHNMKNKARPQDNTTHKIRFPNIEAQRTR